MGKKARTLEEEREEMGEGPESSVTLGSLGAWGTSKGSNVSWKSGGREEASGERTGQEGRPGLP